MMKGQTNPLHFLWIACVCSTTVHAFTGLNRTVYFLHKRSIIQSKFMTIRAKDKKRPHFAVFIRKYLSYRFLLSETQTSMIFVT